MVVVSLRRLPPPGLTPREEAAARGRRPSLPVIPQKSQLSMSSVGHQRSRRPSLWEFHHPFDHAPNRYATDLDSNYCYAVFPDGDEVELRVDPSLRLFELFEEPLRSRQLNVNDVAFFLENSYTPLPENSDCRYFVGQRLLIRRRGAMRVGRHSRATHSMDDSPNDRPSRKMSAEAVSRKSSFANSRMLSKSRQHSENKLFNGSDEAADGRSIDSSLRDVSVADDASTSSEIFDDGGTRRARSVTSSRISLWGFGKETKEVVARLEEMKNEKEALLPELETEKSWTDIVKGYQKLSKRCYEQQEALWELITTEKSYIEVLKFMADLKGYLQRLQRLGLVKEINVEMVFRNYDMLFENHIHFWQNVVMEMLEVARRTGEPMEPSLLESWFQYQNWEEIYTDFTHKHNDSLLYLQKKRKDNQVFAEFVSWAESQQAMRRLKLTDTLTIPMQRLTRYSLLLKAIQRLSTDHDESARLQAMIDRVEKATHQLNYEMNNNEVRMHLEDIQQQIDGYECVDQEELEKHFKQRCTMNLLNPVRFGEPPPGFFPNLPVVHRQLIYRGDLKMKESKQGPKMDVYCMIFTDMFLICRRKGDKLRIIRPPIHMLELGYSASGDTNFILLQMHIMFNTCSQMFLMQTTNPDDSRRWLEMLEQTYYEFHKKTGERMHQLFDPRNHIGIPYDPWSSNDRFRSQFPPSMTNIAHRKSSSMDSQAVAAHAHMNHMHRVTTVSSTEQLDRSTDRLDSGRLPPRQKRSVASCSANPLSSSKSSVDLHLVVGGEPVIVTRSRSRSNSSGPEDGQRHSRSPSPFANGTPPQNGCVPVANDEGQPTSHGRRFEKRYHTADGIEMKPKGAMMPTGILKRFSWNVNSAVGGSSRKISARLGEHSRRHSGASTVASTESFGSSTSGISSSSDGTEVTPKCHVTSVAVNESPSESTLNISLDLLDSDVVEEKESPSAPPLPAIPPPTELTPEPTTNGKELLKYLMEQNLETSDV